MTKFAKLLPRFQANAWPAMLEYLGEHLGVSAESLKKLGIGWCPIVEFKDKRTNEIKPNYQGWWAIPERDAHGAAIGIGLRPLDDNPKPMYLGSKLGLIYAVNPKHKEGDQGYTPGPQNWIRVGDAGMDCPICGKPDGCMVSRENPADPKAVICCRLRGNADRPLGLGYLHIRKSEGNLQTVQSLEENDLPVLIVEGMSDTAVGMDLGFPTVGRHSSNSTIKLLGDLIRGRSAIIVGENDQKPDGRWPGRDGMQATFAGITRACRDVKMVMPPPGIKDLRVWKVNYGLTQTGFLEYVSQHGEAANVPTIAKSNEEKHGRDLTFLASDDELFHDEYGRAYVHAQTNQSQCNTLPADGREYADLLMGRAYWRCDENISANAIKDLQSILVAKAKFDGPKRAIHVRIAWEQQAGEIYVDLADDERQVVKINAEKWEVILDADCPVYFIRPRGMEALPMPIDGGMEPLKNFFAIVNLDDDDQQALIVGYLMSVLQPSGLRPALALSGTQGSGKSTLARMIKRMLDPNRTDLRSIPHTERDLFVAAKNSAILAFDNVSSIPLSMSDPLCRLASGTGFGVRKNYSDDEEMLFEGGRSILLNGIPAELCDRDDLRDRTIVVALPQIPSDRRLTEQELWRRFDELHPQVLGSLFTAAAIALKNYKSINVASSPRMADFYKWVLAAESALPLAIGQFAEAFEHDRRDATDSTLDNSPVGSTIISLIEMKPNRIWRGTYMELLEELERLVNGQFRGRFDWPKTAKALSVLIQRMKPALKERGIEITKLPRQGIGHRIQIKKGGD